MTKRGRLLAALALPLVILTAQSASAGLVMKAKALVCSGSGPVDGKITVASKDSVVTLKFKAKGLVPNQAVQCGYFCEFSPDVDIPCGAVDSEGKISIEIERPQALCFSVVPFFRTGSTGSCVPSIPPP